MRHFLLCTLCSLPLLGGCYVARPVTAIPPAGLTVEAELSVAGTQALTAAIGPNAARLDGVVLAATADSLTLSVREVRLRDGQALFLQGATVPLARGHLSALRGRTLDRRRTAIAAGLGLVGAILVVDQVRLGGREGGGGDRGGERLRRSPRAILDVRRSPVVARL